MVQRGTTARIIDAAIIGSDVSCPFPLSLAIPQEATTWDGRCFSYVLTVDVAEDKLCPHFAECGPRRLSSLPCDFELVSSSAML